MSESTRNLPDDEREQGAATRKLSDADRAIIRRLLLAPREEVMPFGDVALLLGGTGDWLGHHMDELAAECSDEGGRLFFRWSDRVTYVQLRWPLSMIHEALGADVAILEPLLQLARITLRLPEYQVRLLHELAQRNGQQTPSDIVYEELEDLAAAWSHDATIEAAIPGFVNAARFPREE